MTSRLREPGAVYGSVRWILQAESLAVLVAARVLYAQAGHDRRVFALLFLAPDLWMAAYLAGPNVGAADADPSHPLLRVG